ncbi:helix-turn-helix transcriptional regulator [Brevibacterium atlanticum]|uniref:helix-turn-helix transcriptional regulator n=1 Tax=Brevibacterium atlanticum TaxID=2697563 RepID=UPI00141E1452|nr:AraC family transcriptional regulator [Brevibacterium atlanticum]
MIPAQAPVLDRDQISRSSIEEWDSAVDDVHTRLEFRDDSRRSFSGSLSTSSFGRLSACSFRGTALTASRVRRDIAQSDVGTTIMIWQFQGRGRGIQRGIEADLLPGSIMFLDLDAPYEVNCSDEFGQLVIHVPTERLESRLQSRGVRRDFRGASLCSSAEAVPWMCFLGSAFSQAQEAGENSLRSLESPAVEALASLAAMSIGQQGHETNAEVLYREASRVIKAEYSRYDFTAEDLARSLHVSRRTLFRALDKCGAGFSSLLQETRLTAAARILDQTVSTLTLEAVGHTVGYLSASTFYTRFREKFGISPGEYRQQALTIGTLPHIC